MTLRKTINRILASTYRWYLPEVLLFLVSAGLYFFNAFRYALPTGYAGLYTLMSEQLGANAFRLPRTVPFYGPGGFPYAYPPAGFYLAAVFIDALKVPAFVYLRFAPPLLTLLFLALEYILVRQMTGSRLKALLAVSLTSVSGAIYAYHVQAAGMVRSLALAFAAGTLILTWMVLSRPRPERTTYAQAVLAGAALALTVLTHLSYALFAILGIAVFALLAGKCAWRWRLLLPGIILGSALVISAVWWGTILSRFGLVVLTNPARSHGNFEVLHSLAVVGWRSAPALFIQKLIGATFDWTPAVLVGLDLAGLAYLLLKRRWALPVLFLLVFLAVGEPDRFLLITGAIAAAELLGDVLTYVHAQDEKDQRPNFLVYTVAIVILLAYPYYGALKMVRSDQPTLSPSVIQMAAWIREHTSAEAKYLLLDESNDLDEWIPYLTRRTPLVGSWGGEWVGNLASLEYRSSQLDACLASQSDACIQDLIAREKLQVTLLVSPSGNAALNAQIGADQGWQVAYQNDQFAVFARR